MSEEGKSARVEESVWDYPRPPRLEPSTRHIKIVFGDQSIVDTRNALRILETSHPPTYYIPSQDIMPGVMIPASRRSLCEWKGTARYFHLMVDGYSVENAAWTYPEPLQGYEALQDHFAFYPLLMDACYVDGERVQPQAGGFYGGWITRDIVGPFKGTSGTSHW